MVEYVHRRIYDYKGSLAVDFTMGNGYDTYFLASHFENVLAFDIQEKAVVNTQKRCRKFNNIRYILDNHMNMEYYLSSFDIGIFNLGYLPQSDKQLTTSLLSTQIAIKKAIDYMTKVLFIVVYPGHEEGLKESKWLDNYVKKLDTHQYNVSMFKMVNKNKAPYVIEIEKRQ